MKIEKKEVVFGLMAGIVLGLIMGCAIATAIDMQKKQNAYNDYMRKLEFHEQIRKGLVNYRSSLDIESSDYLFEEKINGVNYLVWVKYNDVFDYFDYSYARLGQ